MLTSTDEQDRNEYLERTIQVFNEIRKGQRVTVEVTAQPQSQVRERLSSLLEEIYKL